MYMCIAMSFQTQISRIHTRNTRLYKKTRAHDANYAFDMQQQPRRMNVTVHCGIRAVS
jgi:hypothetical protein